MEYTHDLELRFKLKEGSMTDTVYDNIVGSLIEAWKLKGDAENRDLEIAYFGCAKQPHLNLSLLTTDENAEDDEKLILSVSSDVLSDFEHYETEGNPWN